MTERREGGLLSVVATPIGNLEDITLRALRVLGECDAVLAEDTRRTRTLLLHHKIDSPLRAFHAHTPDSRVESVVDELRAGAHLAIVTDAGTPLISDPGSRLVAAASEAGVRVEPIPGASAPIAALAACGLEVASFRFVGFIPRSGARRREALEAIVERPEATVLFESPRRLPKTLAALAERAPERPAAICRELTKLHEEIARGPLRDLAERFSEAPRGEVTLVIAGRTEPAGGLPLSGDEEALAVERALAEVAAGARTKVVAKALGKKLGVPAREAYERLTRSART